MGQAQKSHNQILWKENIFPIECENPAHDKINADVLQDFFKKHF